MSHRSGSGVEDLVLELRQTTPEEVTERWNLIQRLLARTDPSTDTELALLEAMNELVDVTGGVAPIGPGDSGGGGGGGGGGLGAGPGEGTTADIARLLSLQTRGFVDTRDLPVGATGRSIRSIPNGDEGIAVFPVQGNEMAVPVRAEKDINQFDRVRVVQGPGNTITPIPAEDASTSGGATIQRAEVFDVAVDAGEDILPSAEAVRPQTGGSSLLVAVVLDTAAEFRARVTPDDAPAYDAQFNARASTEALDADSLYQFDHAFGPSVELNYRVDIDGVTVRHLRVTEMIDS